MKKLFLAVTIISIAALVVQPSRAGLGEAEIEKADEFDAWCGRKHNRCKIKLANDKIVVNNQDSVGYEEINSVSKSISLQYRIGGIFPKSYHLYTFNLFFNENGDEKSGVILFENDKAAKAFAAKLEYSTGKTFLVGP